MRDYVVAWLLRDPEDQAHLVARVRKACRRQTVPRPADHCTGSRAASTWVSVLARHRPRQLVRRGRRERTVGLTNRNRVLAQARGHQHLSRSTPLITGTACPAMWTAMTTPARFSVRPRMRLGRPISTPCSIRHVKIPSGSGRSCASRAIVAPVALPVAGSSIVASRGANMRACKHLSSDPRT